ncbi:MAG TPA: ABC transporter ATP-binding protein [Candidatus Avanaerovorax faecigallinarum]|nr:ABC transporter ATP-binding protein [Candidatus Avanaerovorax faecigallinarum]
MSEELLRLENLSIDYKVKEGYLSAVKDVNFSINKGEIFAVVGESGCGKSTVAHSIMNLLPGGNETITGKVIFKGRDLREVTEKEMEKIRGKEIGMIFQNPLDSLNPVYTVGSQVAEAIELDKVDKQEAWNRVIELFKDVKMPDAEERAKSFPHELSGGMRQRVMIAMMISRNPELLIADEPTTALDVTIEAQILAIIKELKEQFNTAVMLITHNFGLVAEVADKIGVMYAGEMVETGDVFEIFKNPVHPYTRLLMAALPRKTKNEGRLQTIEGNVPRITEKKPGCRFANRCPYATEKCKTEDPPMTMVGEDHMVRCHEIGKEEK